ncbi:hypothetical protein [Haloechinothrix salitolerans]|uniref:NERD domain-containing protein n=1 Tax=Haloechinothrix salitolerans TaxID=926830 RepID=A0ABW2C3R8_9PSEU
MNGMDVSRRGEQLFERYLNERGYRWEPHPDLGIGKRPDYLVDAAGARIVCEVKSFNSDGLFSAPGLKIGSRSMDAVLAPHRDDIKKAASQLKRLKDRGWPLMVVLSNPAGYAVPTDPSLVAAAMYGDPILTAPAFDDGSLGEFTMSGGQNGRLRIHHTYISAVAVLRQTSHAAEWARRWIAENHERYSDPECLVADLLAAEKIQAPDGGDVFLDVIETMSESATPLPRDVFDGPRDRRFGPNASRTAIVELAD